MHKYYIFSNLYLKKIDFFFMCHEGKNEKNNLINIYNWHKVERYKPILKPTYLTSSFFKKIP